jgi:Na+/proline symporter
LARRHGKATEILVLIATLVSFMMLLAGSLVGMGVMLSYVWDIEQSNGIWMAAAVVLAYMVSGGLFSEYCMYFHRKSAF